METILNTHHFITCCVHLHIDTNSISIYTPTITNSHNELGEMKYTDEEEDKEEEEKARIALEKIINGSVKSVD